jgi:hypothetical protein
LYTLFVTLLDFAMDINGIADLKVQRFLPKTFIFNSFQQFCFHRKFSCKPVRAFKKTRNSVKNYALFRKSCRRILNFGQKNKRFFKKSGILLLPGAQGGEDKTGGQGQ